MADPLTIGELSAALAALPGWTHRDGALHRTWRFGTFAAAMRFMQAAAPGIDRLDHHPEWSNIYDRVTARLTTHDAGNLVTAADVALARLLDDQAERIAGLGA
jgi:4a-hydroxytetrahydrobiopterin dehydratase